MSQTEIAQLETAIAALEAQRAGLGEAVVDTALAPLREKQAALKAQAQPAARAGAQHRKQVTVLFADVSGFTAMSETMDAEDVGDAMEALWQRLDVAITAHGGRIEKHIGDAVMALWGADAAREDDPQQAVRAALAMQAVLQAVRAALAMQAVLKEEGSRKENAPPSSFLLLPASLQMHIGLNTGPVILSTVSATGEFTAMGDTVNVASRLSDAAPAGGILISHDTYRQVRGLFDALQLEPLRVKGKAEPLQVYLVERARPDAFRLTTRGVEGVETQMVGRETEFVQLYDALREVMEDGELQAVTVVGEAGLGKSRLLYEFHKWLELLPERPRLFTGRAREELQRLPYALLRDVFALRCEIADSDPMATAREKLESGLAGLMAADPEAKMKAHFIGHLIGLDFSESSHLRGLLDDPKQIRDRAFHYLGQFFIAAVTSTAQGRSGGGVLLLEDLHWADDGSLDAIAHLLQACRAVPLLVVAAARPMLFERRPRWGEGLEVHTRLELRPLSRRNTRQLVKEILKKAPEIPPALRDLVVSGAEGNPFYVEELIKMLIDEQVIVPGEEAWQVASERLAQVRVPPTLTSVLQARLDALPPFERETLQRASVIGRVFWDEAVNFLSARFQAPDLASRVTAGRNAGTQDTSTPDAFDSLRYKGFIYGRETCAFVGTSEYIFKHAILRDVTYETVLKKLRRAYHAQAAAWLIEKSGERADEYAALIAEHFERAGETAQVAEWYGRAGDQARLSYAPDAAIGYYQQALDLATTFSASETWKVSWYKGLGEVLRSRARYAEALEAYRAMRVAAEAAEDAISEARAWNGLADVQFSQGNNRALRESAERAETIARGAGEAARMELAEALFRKGWALYRLGDAAGTLVWGEQALALCAKLSDEADRLPYIRRRARRRARLQAGSLNLLSGAHWVLGHFEQADHSMEQALAGYQELDDWRGIKVALNSLGETARLRGDHNAAAARHQEALTIIGEIGDRDLEIGTGTTGWYALPETYSLLAEACLEQGKIAEALDVAQRAMTLAQQAGAPDEIGRAWRALGRVAAKLKTPMVVDEQTYTSAACFAQSLTQLTASGMEPEYARTLLAWADYELEYGDQAQGAAKQQEAQAIFERAEAIKPPNPVTL